MVSTMKLALIVAMDENGLIGKSNNLPWRLSADLQYFRKITMAKPIIMGRKTYESIGRPLPGRQNIIITKNQAYQAQNCTVVCSIDEALHITSAADEVMVMGGGSLYAQLLPHAHKLYLTLVHAKLEGDTWFPKWCLDDWQQLSREDHIADDVNDYPYSFIVYQRCSNSPVLSQ